VGRVWRIERPDARKGIGRRFAHRSIKTTKRVRWSNGVFATLSLRCNDPLGVTKGQGRANGSRWISCECVESVSELFVKRREEMTVPVESDGDCRVAEALLDRLGMGARSDGRGGGRVPEVVQSEALQPGSPDGRQPDTPPEVRSANWATL